MTSQLSSLSDKAIEHSKKIYTEVDQHEQSKGNKVNEQKERIEVIWNSTMSTTWLLWFLFVFFVHQFYRIGLPLLSFRFDENHNVEKKGDENKDDAEQDPKSKGGQSRWF